MWTDPKKTSCISELKLPPTNEPTSPTVVAKAMWPLFKGMCQTHSPKNLRMDLQELIQSLSFIGNVYEISPALPRIYALHHWRILGPANEATREPLLAASAQFERLQIKVCREAATPEPDIKRDILINKSACWAPRCTSKVVIAPLRLCRRKF